MVHDPGIESTNRNFQGVAIRRKGECTNKNSRNTGQTKKNNK
jgi:hypothetical protein